jgi:hypothetical protein
MDAIEPTTAVGPPTVPGRRAGHLTLLVLAAWLAVSAVVTVMPLDAVYKDNILGLRTVCPFAPISTMLLAGAAVGVFRLRRQRFLGQVTS